MHVSQKQVYMSRLTIIHCDPTKLDPIPLPNAIGSLGVPLMQCLAPLLSRVQHGIGGRIAVAFFRSLFLYYKHHWDSDLVQQIYK